MSMYEIINSLRFASGDIEKQNILNANSGNSPLAQFLKWVYDPAISYYQSKLPKLEKVGEVGLSNDTLYPLVSDLSNRYVTGKAAIKRLKDFAENLNAEGQELLRVLIDRKIGADVGDSMVLKAFPGLYFVPPYQRCSGLNPKTRALLQRVIDKYGYVIVQTKMDGSFAYFVKRRNGKADVITRQGNMYPDMLGQYIEDESNVVIGNGQVFVGEMLVGMWVRDEAASAKSGLEVSKLEILPRKDGNGILNAIMQGAEIPANHAIRYVAWDFMSIEEFEAGAARLPYANRLEYLEVEFPATFESAIEIVYGKLCKSMAEVFEVYNAHTSRGLEGVVAKSPASLWKDGTAADIIKFKIKFEAEYRCVGMYEGEGKDKGKLGGINIETEDGLLACNCGTGFSAKQREEFFKNPELIVGHVVCLSANDVIQSRDARKKPALSLPVFEEVRYDKKAVGADTLQRVLEQLESAKQGN